MTANTATPNGSRELLRTLLALGTGFVCGAVIGLVVTAIGRLLAVAHPASAVWFTVLVVTALAALVGIGTAERAGTLDLVVLRRRFAGTMLLGGIALAVVLAGFSFLPSLQPGTTPDFLVVLGPAVAMLFFPVLLLTMGPRMAAAIFPEFGVRIAIAAILGAVSGWLLAFGPSAPLVPSYAIALAAGLAHAVGLTAAWSARLMGHHKSIAGVVVLVTVTAAILLAERTGSGTPLVIGSV